MAIFLCVGDSITYGNWGKSGGWVARLRRFLDERNLNIYKGEDLYTKHYTLVYNLGIPGDTTQGLLDRFDKEIAPRFNPELKTIIIFAIGINDSRYYENLQEHAVSFETYQKNLPELFEKAKKYTSEIIFVGLTPVDEKRTDPLFWETQAFYRNEFIKRYDSEIREFCERQGIKFIEIFDRMVDDDVASLMEDGIHPNDLGYEKIFEIIKEYLDKNKLI